MASPQDPQSKIEAPTRVRTHRKKGFFFMSNSTAQDNNMSLEALGLLTYCLSMPEDWEFYPKVIWKERKVGRDKIYGLFNELIKNYRCIRVKQPNPYAKHLPGRISYEIFDDPDDCKARIKELEKEDVFVESGDELKKSFRHPAFQEPKNTEPENPYITKEEQAIQTKETTTKRNMTAAPPVVVFSCLEKIDIPQAEKEWLSSKYDEPTVQEAIAFATNPKTEIKTSLIATIKWACQRKPQAPIDYEQERQDKAELARQEFLDNRALAEHLTKEYFKKYQDPYVLRPTADYIEINIDERAQPVKIYYHEKNIKEKIMHELSKKRTN